MRSLKSAFHGHPCLGLRVQVVHGLGEANRLEWVTTGRLSHEFLLFGIRGQIRSSHATTSASLVVKLARTRHSQANHSRFRELIEQVSPGPYLELYGREELPNTGLDGLRQSSRAETILMHQVTVSTERRVSGRGPLIEKSHHAVH